MRIALLLACLPAFLGVAAAQDAPETKAEQPALAPAAYQPAVLNAPSTPEPTPPAAGAPNSQPPVRPAARSGRFVRDPRTPAAVAAARARIEAQRAAILRDPRFTPQSPATTQSDQPVHHGDSRSRWTIGLSVDSLFNTDAEYDLFDDDNVSTRLGGWASYDLAELAPRLVLAVELGFGVESHEQGIWQDALRTKLDSQTFSAGVSLRYALAPWLDPQLRLSGGVSRFEFDLDTPNGVMFEDNPLSSFGTLGAGVLVHTPARLFENQRGQFASVSIGLLIEGGYALRSGLDFELSRKASDHAIPIIEAGFGALALSGPYVRSSVFVRF